ncbi:MAG: efflux RND transporter periplasmic adaptor subunit [Chitinophagaceae bacterium]
MLKKYIAPVLVIFLWNACQSTSSPDDQKTDRIDSTKIPRLYSAFLLKKTQEKLKISLPAELRSQEAAKIFSKVNGFVRFRGVDIGSEVRKGSILAILEAPELTSQMDDARALMESAKSRFLISQDGYQRLLKSARTPGVIAPVELEKEKNQMLSDSANYIASKFHFQSEQDLNHYLIITSPFKGVVTQRNVDIGDLVDPHSPQPMFEVEMNQRLRLLVPIPESLTGKELDSKEIKFSVPAFQGQYFPAQFARRSNSLDVSNRSEIWEFEANNPHGDLKPGMYADAHLELIPPQGSFIVPKSAVINTLERNFVVRLHHGQTQLVDIQDGMIIDHQVEIFGALHQNDTLLVHGSEEMKNGMKIQVKFPVGQR